MKFLQIFIWINLKLHNWKFLWKHWHNKVNIVLRLMLIFTIILRHKMLVYLLVNRYCMLLYIFIIFPRCYGWIHKIHSWQPFITFLIITIVSAHLSFPLFKGVPLPAVYSVKLSIWQIRCSTKRLSE